MHHAALRPLCAHGHALTTGSRSTDGVATEYCGTCGVESVTTIRGLHRYDQRDRYEAKLTKKVGKECASVDTSYQRVRTMNSLEVY